jgi:hypothetical protein
MTITLTRPAFRMNNMAVSTVPAVAAAQEAVEWLTPSRTTAAMH